MTKEERHLFAKYLLSKGPHPDKDSAWTEKLLEFIEELTPKTCRQIVSNLQPGDKICFSAKAKSNLDLFTICQNLQEDEMLSVTDDHLDGRMFLVDYWVVEQILSRKPEWVVKLFTKIY